MCVEFARRDENTTQSFGDSGALTGTKCATNKSREDGSNAQPASSFVGYVLALRCNRFRRRRISSTPTVGAVRVRFFLLTRVFLCVQTPCRAASYFRPYRLRTTALVVPLARMGILIKTTTQFVVDAGPQFPMADTSSAGRCVRRSADSDGRHVVFRGPIAPFVPFCVDHFPKK